MKALVIEVPGLHLGYLGCYGNDWIDTPHLDRLAAEGVVFDRHFADCPNALAPGRWTGHYRFPLPDDPPPSDDDLADQLEHVFGLQRLFAARGITLKQNAAIDSFGSSGPRETLEEVVQAALAGLEQLVSLDGWMMWVGLRSLIPPWQVPPEFLDPYFAEEEEEEAQEADEEQAEDSEPLVPWPDPPIGPIDTSDDRAWQRLQNTFAAAVAHLDAQLGLILEQLEKRKPLDDVMICVTANRGLALGEHGIIGDCRPWLHEEVMHLPLIIRLPGGAEAGRRVSALTQPVDLLPTLLAAFDVPIPDSLHGRNLLPLIHGETAKIRDYACAGLQLGERIEWALRTPDWSFILPVRQTVDDPPRPKQLYVKPDDRWEFNDLLQHHLEWAERLEKTLRAFVDASRRPGPLVPPGLFDK
jgi:arylsulfatase A-like enzyme